MGQPTLEVAQPGVGGFVKLATDIGFVDKQAHQNEHGQHRHAVVCGCIHDNLTQHVKRWIDSAQGRVTTYTGKQHGKSQRYACKCQQKNGGKANECCGHTTSPLLVKVCQISAITKQVVRPAKNVNTKLSGA